MSLFQELILISLGKRDGFSRRLTDKDWTSIYTEAQRQSLVGVLLKGVEKAIASGENKPKFLMQWIAQTLKSTVRCKVQRHYGHLQWYRIAKLCAEGTRCCYALS